MSDKEVELTEEQLKEQKLEAARKKYEQLKNKKGKKKKSKKDKKEEENEDSKEASVEPSEDAAADVKDAEETSVEKDEAEETVSEKKTEKTDEEKSVEVAAKEDATEESKTEVKEETKEETKTDEESKPVIEEPKPTEESVEDKITAKLDDIKINDTDNNTPAKEESKEEPTDDLFPDSGPSFMDTIKQAQSDEALTKAQQENTTLKAELEKVKKDNKDLKLLKLDHLEQIETLEARVADLEAKLSKAKVDSSGPSAISGATHLTAYDNDETLSLSPTPSFQQSFPTSFSQFKPHHKNESQLSVAELKARLNKWRGWNIDMTNWRSVGSGPVVEL